MMSESRVRINTRADDTADASTVATTLGAARAPDGFEIVEQCPLPDVADRTELNKLVGEKILYAFDDEHYGWYIGTIAGTGLGTRDLKQTPRANCVVSYNIKGKRPWRRLWTGRWLANSPSICMG